MRTDGQRGLQRVAAVAWARLSASVMGYCCISASVWGRSHSYPCLAARSAFLNLDPGGLYDVRESGNMGCQERSNSLECICKCSDNWNVRMGVLVARGGVSEEVSTCTTGGMAVSVLEFGGGIDISMTNSGMRLSFARRVDNHNARTFLGKRWHSGSGSVKTLP